MNPELHKELKFRTSRSAGSGGQHVNKVSTKVELIFNIEESAQLSEQQKRRIKKQLENRINKAGALILTESSTRSQLKNKNRVIKKFDRLLQQALMVQKKRIATKPSKGDVEKRLQSKKRHSDKKAMRKKLLFALPMLLFIALQWSCQEHPYQQGAILYTNFCASCHMEDGTGLVGQIPPLAGADYIAENPVIMACIIRNGMEGPIVVNDISYDQPMEGIKRLKEFEITNIINYINQAWGNDYGYTKHADVRAALKDCR